MQVEPRLRHFKGDMWTEEADGQKEGLGLRCAHFPNGPIHHHVVAGLFIGHAQWGGPEKFRRTQWPARTYTHFRVGLELRANPVFRNRVEWVAAVGVPRRGIVLRVAGCPLQGVENLPATHGPVAVIAKVLG